MIPLSPLFPKRRREEHEEEGTRPYIFLALLVGVLMIVGSYQIPSRPGLVETAKDLLKELGVVLISVWGVSLFYERFLAERHFNRFHANLEKLIRQGETNAATCEALGILEIHRSRRSFEEKHPLAKQVKDVGPGDIVRITGRSLIFSLYAWQHLKEIAENGATLNLCLYDPSIRQTPLEYLSGYSPQETDLVINRVISKIKPWLKIALPKGTVEIRYHDIHLLDSLLEVTRRNEYRVSLDLNFAEGIEERQVFYLNGEGQLGRNLTEGRYAIVWDKSTVMFRYSNGNFEVDKLSTDPK
jgi:hypothetical protein